MKNLKTINFYKKVAVKNPKTLKLSQREREGLKKHLKRLPETPKYIDVLCKKISIWASAQVDTAWMNEICPEAYRMETV